MTLVLLLVYCNYFNVLCGVSAERFCKVTDIVSFPQIFQELFFRSRAALPLQRGCFPKASAKVVAFSEPTKYFNIFLSQNFHMKSQPAVSAAVMAQSFFQNIYQTPMKYMEIRYNRMLCEKKRMAIFAATQ